MVILVPEESAFNALFNDTLDKAYTFSQQKLQSDKYVPTFYRHVRGLHIINSHTRNTNSRFPMKCIDFRSL